MLRLVSTGLSDREIAQRLFISENTVKNHVRNILEKLQLHSHMEAVMYAVREHLLSRLTVSSRGDLHTKREPRHRPGSPSSGVVTLAEVPRAVGHIHRQPT